MCNGNIWLEISPERAVDLQSIHLQVVAQLMAFAPATRVQAPGLVVGVAAAAAAALGVLVDVDVLGAGQLVQGLAVAVPAAHRAFLLDCRSLRLVGNGEAGQGVGVVDEHLVQLTDEALDVAAIVLVDRATDLLHLGVDLHRAAADLQPVGLVGVQRLDEVGNRLAAVLARLDVEERLAAAPVTLTVTV